MEYTMNKKEGTEYSCVKWMQEYQKELEKVKDHSQLLLTLGVSVGIEFLGKLLHTDNLDSNNNCCVKFEKALKSFSSLQKYSKKELYKLVRCGLVHRVSMKKGIILSPSENTDLDSATKVLNTNQFFSDFAQAVKDAQKKTDWPNPNATTKYIYVSKDSNTGSTTN